MRLIFDPAKREVFDERYEVANISRALRERIIATGLRECARFLHRRDFGRWNDKVRHRFRVALPPSFHFGISVGRMPSTAMRVVEVDVVNVDAARGGRVQPLRAIDALKRGELNAAWFNEVRMAPLARFEPFFRDDAEMRRIQQQAQQAKQAAEAQRRHDELAKEDARFVTSTRWQDGHHFIAKLHDQGFRQIGAGAYSTVLAKPGSGRVIKVSRKLDRWPDYVMWASKHGYAGSLAPRVFSLKLVKGTREKFYVAVVERLDATVGEVMKDSRGARYRDEATSLSMLIRGRQSVDGIKSDRALAFAIRLRQEFAGSEFDLHLNNWMVKKGRVVLTDPICDDRLSDTTPKRVRARDFAAFSSRRAAA